MSTEDWKEKRDAREAQRRRNESIVRVTLAYRSGTTIRLALRGRIYQEMMEIKNGRGRRRQMEGYDANDNRFQVDLGNELLAIIAGANDTAL